MRRGQNPVANLVLTRSYRISYKGKIKVTSLIHAVKLDTDLAFLEFMKVNVFTFENISLLTTFDSLDVIELDKIPNLSGQILFFFFF